MVRQSDNSLPQHAIQAKAFNQASKPLNQSLNLHETRKSHDRHWKRANKTTAHGKCFIFHPLQPIMA